MRILWCGLPYPLKLGIDMNLPPPRSATELDAPNQDTAQNWDRTRQGLCNNGTALNRDRRNRKPQIKPNSALLMGEGARGLLDDGRPRILGASHSLDFSAKPVCRDLTHGYRARMDVTAFARGGPRIQHSSVASKQKSYQHEHSYPGSGATSIEKLL